MSDDRFDKEQMKISPVGRGKFEPPTFRIIDTKGSKITPPALLYEINLEKLSQGIAAELNAAGVGYCFMIGKAGKILHMHASGWAQRPGDGEVLWGFHVPMDIASVSKVVTAMAAIHTLRAACVPLSASILPYLPAYWFKGPGVEQVTFRDLLRHESGLGTSHADGGPGDFPGAKHAIRLGTSGLGPKPFDYKNLNYALLRCLLPVVAGLLRADTQMPATGSSAGSLFPGVNEGPSDEYWDRETCLDYLRLVNQNIFPPAQIEPRDARTPEGSAKAYAFPSTGMGWQLPDASAVVGQGGWHLTMGELIRLLAAFRGGKIISKDDVRMMMDERLGFDLPVETELGPVPCKGGRSCDGHRNLDSVIFLLPGGANLAIFTNAARSSGRDDVPDRSCAEGVPELIRLSVENRTL